MSPANTSLFVVIEGLDGSGKTTASRQLAARLETLYPHAVKTTFEPNDNFCAGAYIRSVLTKQINDFDPNVLPLAFAANRLDHCHRLINPWLAGGDNRIVISDRFYLSTLVYQHSSTYSFDKIMLLNEFARRPDITFFINVDNKTCYERMKIRNQPEELFEGKLSEMRLKYFEAIAYLRAQHGDIIIEIDGSGTVETIVENMLAHIRV